MNKHFIPFLLLLFWGCISNEKASGPSSERLTRFDAAYYETLPNNLQRILSLQEGYFVQYLQRSSAEATKPWLVGQDSVILYSRQLGEPNKEGYWLLKMQFLSSLPASPLSCWLEHYEKASRDTFLCKTALSMAQTEVPKHSTVAAPDFTVKQISPKSLLELKPEEDVAVRNYYIREGAMQFRSESALTPPAHAERRERYAFRKDLYQYNPKVHRLKVVFLHQDSTRAENESMQDMTHLFYRLTDEQVERMLQQQPKQED